jgi:hypothetical protein
MSGESISREIQGALDVSEQRMACYYELGIYTGACMVLGLEEAEGGSLSRKSNLQGIGGVRGLRGEIWAFNPVQCSTRCNALQW